MKELKPLPEYAPIDPGVRRLINTYVEELNKLSKAVYELKETIKRMDVDV